MGKHDYTILRGRYMISKPFTRKRSKSFVFEVRDTWTGIVREKSSKLKTVKSARQEVVEWVEDLDDEENALKTMEFSEAMKAFLKERERDVRPATMKFYQERVDLKLNPYFKGKLLSNIEREDVLGFREFCENKKGSKEKNSARYVAMHIGLLRQLFKWGIALGYCDRDPTVLLKTGASRKAGKPISAEDIKKLLEVLKKPKIVKIEPNNRNAFTCEYDQRPIYLFTIIALFTGLRRKNILELSPKHLDLSEGSIKFKPESMKREHPHKIPIHSCLLEELKHELKKLGTTSKPFVKLTIRRIYEGLEWAFKEAKIDKFRPHDFRHTFATFIEERWPLPVVSSLLHHSPKTQSESYVHPKWERLVEAVESIPDWRGNQGNKSKTKLKTKNIASD